MTLDFENIIEYEMYVNTLIHKADFKREITKFMELLGTEGNDKRQTNWDWFEPSILYFATNSAGDVFIIYRNPHIKLSYMWWVGLDNYHTLEFIEEVGITTRYADYWDMAKADIWVYRYKKMMVGQSDKQFVNWFNENPLEVKM